MEGEAVPEAEAAGEAVVPLEEGEGEETDGA